MMPSPADRTFGPAYDAAKDGKRLANQLEDIKRLMLDGVWRTLKEIEKATRHPQASISSQLRHLKKEQFGSYRKEKRRRAGSGTWEYRILPPLPRPQGGVLANPVQTSLLPVPAHCRRT